MKKNEEQDVRVQKKSPAKDGKKKILIVDDDHFLTEMLKRTLEREGYEVHSAADSYRAITMLNKLNPNLILLDIMLPSMSGLELLNVIRYQRFNDRIPIIMISGISNSNFVSQALRMGGNDYFAKPLDIPRLINRVEQLILEEK